jgi:hypothetical protein
VCVCVCGVFVSPNERWCRMKGIVLLKLSLRLNYTVLEAYSACKDGKEVRPPAPRMQGANVESHACSVLRWWRRRISTWPRHSRK